MRKLFIIFLVFLIAGVTGCGNSTSGKTKVTINLGQMTFSSHSGKLLTLQRHLKEL